MCTKSEIIFLHFKIAADIILIIITNILGMLEFYLSDKKQRRAFIDTRQSLEMKLVIEEQAKEQVHSLCQKRHKNSHKFRNKKGHKS